MQGRTGEQVLRQTGQIGEQMKVGVHPKQGGHKGEREGEAKAEIPVKVQGQEQSAPENGTGGRKSRGDGA